MTIRLLVAAARMPDWVDRAACRGSDVDLFFPGDKGDIAARDIALAAAICARCAVRDACLDWAVTTNEEFGIWAGTKPGDRRKLRERRRLAS